MSSRSQELISLSHAYRAMGGALTLEEVRVFLQVLMPSDFTSPVARHETGQVLKLETSPHRTMGVLASCDSIARV